MNIARKPPRPITFQVMLDGEYAEVSIIVSDNTRDRIFDESQLDHNILNRVYGIVNEAKKIARADR